MPDDSLLQTLLHRAVTPLTTAPTQLADKRAMEMSTPHLNESKAHAMANGMGAGMMQGIGRLASGMTSPLSLALMAAGPAYKGITAGAGALGDAASAAAPAAETLGEVSSEFTPVGGEDLYNVARSYKPPTPDPSTAAYRRILPTVGRAVN